MEHRGSHHTLALALLLSLFLVRSSAGFAPAARRIISRHNRSAGSGVIVDSPSVRRNMRGEKDGRSAVSLHLLRGGALAVSKPIVAKACVGLLALQGVSLLFSPVLVSKRLHKIDIQEDPLETYLLRAIGAISIGMSVNIYLSVVQNMQAQRAMGFGLLPRFLYILKSSLIGKDLEKLGGSNRFLSTNEVVMAWTTFSLLTGAGNPIVSAKVFSCMALLKGAFLFIDPVAASKKSLGIDVSTEGTRIMANFIFSLVAYYLCFLHTILPTVSVGMQKSKALCRDLGNELIASALFMGTLAFGMNPVKAAGFAFLWGFLAISFRDMARLQTAEDTPQRILSLCISALLAAGFPL